MRDVDVAELFDRLKREVRTAPAIPPGEASSGPLAARADAERLWAVAVDVPIEHRPGMRGRLVYGIKRVLRKLMSWYVGPLAADQRNFNHTALRLVDELHARLEAAGRRAEALEERLGALDERARGGARLGEELEERLLRLERARRPAPPPPDGDGEAAIDYFALTARLRGSAADIRERQRPYVEDFREAAPVLDVGCGRGEFLGLLRDEGIQARGVERDADMAAYARGEGLDVVEGDALAHLADLEDASLGGIFSAQVVEHLPPGRLLRFLELAARKLRSGGLLVAETINPLSPRSLRYYFSDVSHAQPLVPETLALFARQAGFRVEEIRYLNEPEERLQARDPACERNVGLLNEQLFAPLDYALVARTP